MGDPKVGQIWVGKDHKLKVRILEQKGPFYTNAEFLDNNGALWWQTNDFLESFELGDGIIAGEQFDKDLEELLGEELGEDTR
jgi:hypothetical protein